MRIYTHSIEFCDAMIKEAIANGDSNAAAMWTRKLCRYVFGAHGMALFLRGNKC